jgi:hypothetical protein
MLLGVFLLGSCCPAWTVWEWAGWKAGAWGAVGHDGDLWEAIGNVPFCLRQSPDNTEFWGLQDGNLFSTAVLLLISIGLGLLVYWIGMGRRRPVEAADYNDAPGGAVPDGRIDPPPPSHAAPPTA